MAKTKYRPQLRSIPKSKQGDINKAILDEYFSKHNMPKCHYCKQDVYRARTGQHSLMYNNATVDHVYPIGDIRRLVYGAGLRTVVACSDCNAQRNTDFAKQRNEFYASLYPIEPINLLELC